MASELNVGSLVTTGYAGIGVTPDMPLVVKTTNAIQTMKLNGHHTGYGSSLQFDSTDAGGLNFELVSGGSGTGGGMNSKFSVRDVANNAARLSIDSTGLATFSNGIAVTTGGIKFPATQSASADANTLDDYEEGYHTMVATTSGGGTFTVTTGYDELSYTKVGRVVHLQGSLFFTSLLSGTDGDLKITIPFTAADLNDLAGTGMGSVMFYKMTTGDKSCSVRISDNEDFMTFVFDQTAATYGTIQGSDVAATTTRIYFGVSYIAA